MKNISKSSFLAHTMLRSTIVAHETSKVSTYVLGH